ncbi:elongation factor P--(R)-beta-lysine ligase [Planctomycetota bacterium]|nr:elongation factor P--(R)-beta-lysine ligase [Planctomycetota bacterium]
MTGRDWRPTASSSVLRQRARLVERMREFFAARGVLEVDPPLLQPGANLDHGVAPFRIDGPGGPYFLPTSPEHPLKRLVAAGSGAVWALAPAFRAGEVGRWHSPEFRMLEWYRPGWDDRQLIDEVIALLAALTGWPEADSEIVSWREIFKRQLGLDPFAASDDRLLAALGSDAGVAQRDGAVDRALALDVLLVRDIERGLGRGRWTVVTDYPASACAQARLRTDRHGTAVAARFEIYRDGVELANGYHELTDGAELAVRLERERQSRPDADRLVLDGAFLAAMAAGLPDCAGVAVGFDRVVALALGCDGIAAVQPFGHRR